MGLQGVMANEFCNQGFKLHCLVDSHAEDNPVCTFNGKCSLEEQTRLPNFENKIVTLITQRQMEQLTKKTSF